MADLKDLITATIRDVLEGIAEARHIEPDGAAAEYLYETTRN